MALASSIFDTGITWKIKDEFAVLLEWLSSEDLRKVICRISLGSEVVQLFPCVVLTPALSCLSRKKFPNSTPTGFYATSDVGARWTRRDGRIVHAVDLDHLD